MKFKIYMAGFQEMDSAYSPPHFVGEAEGNTFQEACAKFFVRDAEDRRFYDLVRNTYWSLKLAPSMQEVV